jgi:Fe2+ or Zn2+ uptake regulation protein
VPDLCPPHFFLAAWQSEDHGVIYCRLCGDVRELAMQKIEAPAEESDARTEATNRREG